MHTIAARNVAQALPAGLGYLLTNGSRETSRAGDVLVAPTPVTTVYSHPRERVLFSIHRDANPFFHLMESLWMLAGRRDAAFLNNYVKNFGERFAEEDGNIHDAYGYRWRWATTTSLMETEENPYIDQLDVIVSELIKSPGSRQAVLAMWDLQLDLGVPGLKTRPCNTHAYFRVRRNIARENHANPFEPVDYLDMTVCCRSNDIIMGAYGANAVHFSILHEYLAARLGAFVGTYYQVSNNFHAYVTDVERLRMRASGQPSNPNHAASDMSLVGALRDDRYNISPIVSTVTLVDDPATFDEELGLFMGMADELHALPRINSTALPEIGEHINTWNNHFFNDVAWPAALAMRTWRLGHKTQALEELDLMANCDWRVACAEWMTRRLK